MWAITVGRAAAVHRYLREPRLRVVTDCDNRYLWDSVQTLDYVVVVYVIGLIKDHDVRILNDISKKLMDTVGGGAPRELLADICRMLAEGLAKNGTGTLTQAADVSVGDGGAFFKSIESMACEHCFTDTAGATDQGVMWGRSTERWLKRTGELAQSLGYPPPNLAELMFRDARQPEKSRLLLSERVAEAFVRPSNA